jgi:hypothetical protein
MRALKPNISTATIPAGIRAIMTFLIIEVVSVGE